MKRVLFLALVLTTIQSSGGNDEPYHRMTGASIAYSIDTSDARISLSLLCRIQPEAGARYHARVTAGPEAGQRWPDEYRLLMGQSPDRPPEGKLETLEAGIYIVCKKGSDAAPKESPDPRDPFAGDAGRDGFFRIGKDGTYLIRYQVQVTKDGERNPRTIASVVGRIRVFGLDGGSPSIEVEAATPVPDPRDAVPGPGE